MTSVHPPDCNNNGRNAAELAASCPTMSPSGVARDISCLAISDPNDAGTSNKASKADPTSNKMLDKTFSGWATGAFSNIESWPVSVPMSCATSIENWKVSLSDSIVFVDQRSRTLGSTPSYDQLLCDKSGSSGGYAASLDTCVPRSVCSLYSNNHPVDVEPRINHQSGCRAFPSWLPGARSSDGSSSTQMSSVSSATTHASMEEKEGSADNPA